MKIKLALYRWIGHPDWEPDVHIIKESTDPDRPNVNTYRASEVIEVEFPELSISAQTERAFAGIDCQRAEAQREFSAACDRIKDAEAAHRLLTHDDSAELSSDIPF